MCTTFTNTEVLSVRVVILHVLFSDTVQQKRAIAAEFSTMHVFKLFRKVLLKKLNDSSRIRPIFVELNLR